MTTLPPPPANLPPVAYDGTIFGYRTATGWGRWGRLTFDEDELVMGTVDVTLRAGRNRVRSIRFGRHDLKGVPGDWNLLAVES